MLEGAARPGHFDGVVTVVAKLLQLTAPDLSVFGRKDAQQLAIIQRLVADLDLPVRIEPVEIQREPTGLARSSRNAYLSRSGRQQALALSRTIAAALEAAPSAAGIKAALAEAVARAEEFLGGWLAERGHTATVGSKWGYIYVAGWRTDADTHEIKSHDLDTLERQWPETLEALGRTPDLYLIHSATLETGVLEDERVLARLGEVAQPLA